jgi:hypothetical protein
MLSIVIPTPSKQGITYQVDYTISMRGPHAVRIPYISIPFIFSLLVRQQLCSVTPVTQHRTWQTS